MNPIADIRAHHRERRYAMKVQQKIDRALESFVRINRTNWRPDASEKEREKFNREVEAIIAAARNGQGDAAIVELVKSTDLGRAPFDTMRDAAEAEMKKLARKLSVFPWIKSIRDAAELGLATIVAEAGDLSNYRNVDKLRKRLGFAPYDGCAGSTWKREKWRPHALTKEEWIDNPFSGEHYALLHQVALWLVNAQVEGAEKSGTEFGRPLGPYGEAYVHRREHTKVTHPEWSKQHCRMDGLRVAMKVFLKDLWSEWQRCEVPAELKEAAE